MSGLFPVSIEEQIAEIDREIKLREWKYPDWIAAGTVKKEVADRQMERIRAVRESLYRLKALEGIKP